MQRTPSQPPEIDGYIVDRLIGSGGFADVFLYEQQLPRRKVAVKALLTHELTPTARAAFTTEADLMARLSTHPYIVTIYQAGVARDGRPYLVMEYCSRPSLAERYKRQPLTVVDALRTGVRLAGAVATAHAAGILHRDIKPGNVLTNDYGWPALTDFGIASEVSQAHGDGELGGLPLINAAGAMDADASVGMSVPWSPPEMFLDVPKPDVRSDVFSLAATIHTVLAGRTPFEVPAGPNGTHDLVARIERGELTPLSRDDVPVSLIAVLAKGMSPRRENRYGSAIEFARALQRVELELGYAPTTIDLPMPLEDGDGASGALVSEAALGDETNLRRVPQVIAQPTVVVPTRASAPATDPSSAAPPESRRRLLLGVVIGALTLLAIAAIVVASVIAPPTEPANPTAGPSGDSVVLSMVPQVTDGVATPSADGTSVVFGWTNPSPKAGDIYYWARAETPSDRQATHDPTATVAGVVPGSRVCIDVEVGRAGATGAALRICTSG